MRNIKYKPPKKPTLLLIISFFLIILTIFYISFDNFIFDAITFNRYIKYDVNSVDLPSEVFLGEKYVHLDLKGAPPKVSYYENLFPLLAKLGATGLLIEYEDMFPYGGDVLKNIPAHNAYSLVDIKKINSLAERNNLSIVPLVQSFGHLEFVLKLKEFSYLREVQRYPQVVCPTNNMTYKILFGMVSQIIEAHPRSTMIHIGGDEVFHIGMCNSCIKLMEEQKVNRNDLFLMHIGQITRLIKKNYPHMYVLMWDDQFRTMSEKQLKASALSHLVEPVVWKYDVSVIDDLGYDLFNTYAEVFPNIWIASAFKGATGSNKYLTAVSHHMKNHISWMNVYHEYKNKIHIHGIFITGWQRFDHFAVLCELLPVGIPSLAMSLALLLGYNLTYLYTLPKEIVKLLQCQNPLGLLGFDNGAPYCSFPGGQVLDLMLNFYRIKRQYSILLDDSRMKGWIRSYNIDHSFSSPDHIYSILPSLHNIMSQLSYIYPYLSDAMLDIYDNYTVVEWMEIYYVPFFNDVKGKVDATTKLLSMNYWPRRPLPGRIDL